MWPTETPTEIGYYFFYGFLYGKFFKEKPKLEIVEVCEAGSGETAHKMYIVNGGFAHKSEMLGYWQKIKTPTLPEFKL